MANNTITVYIATFCLLLALALGAPTENQPAEEQKQDLVYVEKGDLKPAASHWGGHFGGHWGGWGGWGGHGHWGGYYPHYGSYWGWPSYGYGYGYGWPYGGYYGHHGGYWW